MPSRLLREGILDSEAVNSLSPEAELFYRRLMSVVDDFGRFDGRVAVLRGRLYALQMEKVREASLTRWILECEKANLIRVYHVDGKPYIEFFKLGPARAVKSKFPSPDDAANTQPFTGENNRLQVKTPVPYSGSGSGTYSGSSSDSINACSEPVKAPASEPPVLVFPVVGKQALKEWGLTDAKLTEYRESFPGVDVLQEARKARQWCIDNPPKRKTPGGMPKFLASWFGRVQDRPAAPSTNGAPRKSQFETQDERNMRRTVEIIQGMRNEQSGTAEIE